MPLVYLRQLTSPERTRRADRHLAHYLTFVAGAVNAGGFIAVGHYTSHMSGIVSSMADHVALRQWTLVAAGTLSVAGFIAGSAMSAWLINWGRRRDRQSLYAAPLLLESGLLLLFGLAGGYAQHDARSILPFTVVLLCFIMGLQNAMVTKLSHAEIRTTHITGMVTDIGIELGKLAYWNRDKRYDDRVHVRADRPKLRLLASLVATFFAGGTAGALGFAYAGFVFAVPLAVVPFLLALVPVHDDLRASRFIRP